MARLIAVIALALSAAACGADTDTVAIHVNSGDPPATCEAFCSGRGYSCADTCAYNASGGGGTGAGAGSYTSGSDFFEVDLIDACDTPISDTNASGYDLFQFSCCCDIPAQTRVDDPDLSAPSTCTDVCAAEGMTCNPQTFWPDPFSEGGFLEETAATYWIYEGANSRALNTGGCDDLPGDFLPGDVLTVHRCGCQ